MVFGACRRVLSFCSERPLSGARVGAWAALVLGPKCGHATATTFAIEGILKDFFSIPSPHRVTRASTHRGFTLSPNILWSGPTIGTGFYFSTLTLFRLFHRLKDWTTSMHLSLFNDSRIPEITSHTPGFAPQRRVSGVSCSRTRVKGTDGKLRQARRSLTSASPHFGPLARSAKWWQPLARCQSLNRSVVCMRRFLEYKK